MSLVTSHWFTRISTQEQLEQDYLHIFFEMELCKIILLLAKANQGDILLLVHDAKLSSYSIFFCK